MRSLESRWNIKAFIFCHVFAILLLVSWLCEPTRHLWDLFDDIILQNLNASLKEKSAWSAFWAIANVRVVDIATGLTMMIPLLRPNWVVKAANIRHAFFAFISLLVLMVVLRIGFTTLAANIDFGAHRASPSLLQEGIVRLSELYPDWDVKDSSKSSFPGDHASVLLIWAMFLSFFARGWRLAIIWAMAIIYMLPRLFAGAHWGSDDFVGGLFIALIALAWGCFTPLVAELGNRLEVHLTPLLRKLGRVPVVGKISLFQDTDFK